MDPNKWNTDWPTNSPTKENMAPTDSSDKPKTSRKLKEAQRKKARQQRCKEAAKTNPDSKDGKYFLGKKERRHDRQEQALHNEVESLKVKRCWEDDEEELDKIHLEIKLTEAKADREHQEAKRFKALKSDPTEKYPEKRLPLEESINRLRQEILSKDQEEVVDNKWKYTSKDEIIVHVDNHTITGYDLKSLQYDTKHSGWLNNFLVDYYLSLIAKTAPIKTYVFHTGFDNLLIDKFQDAKKYRSRKPDFLNYQLYILPILINSHWTILYYNPDRHLIGHFNSLLSHGPDPNIYFKRVNEFFKSLFERNDKTWTEPTIDSRTIPQQNTPH